MFQDWKLRVAPYSTALFGIILTLAAFFWSDTVVQSKREMAFATFTDDSLTALNGRLRRYLQSLDGLVGLLDASDQVSAQEWKRYVSALRIEENLPGLNGLGYILMVDGDETDQFQENLLERGVTDLVVHPETGNSQKLIIVYAEPAEASEGVVGLDISFEENRRSAAMNSRDSGTPEITRSVQLVQNRNDEASYLFLTPHYQRGMPHGTESERHQAFLGWISASFIVSEVLSDLTSVQGKFFTITVSEMETSQGKDVIFQSPASGSDKFAKTIIRKKLVSILGHTWEIEWQSTPVFEEYYNHHRVKWFILTFGLSITILLFLYMRSTYQRQNLISRQVENKTHEIREILEYKQSIMDNALIGVLVMDSEDRILEVNHTAENLFGRKQQDLQGVRLQDLIEGSPTRSNLPSDIFRSRPIDGESLFLNVQRNSWSLDREPRQTVLISDVTAKTLSDRALEESERRWKLTLKYTETGVFDYNLETNTSVVSETWLKLMNLPLDGPEINYRKNFLSRIHPDDKPPLLQKFRACILDHTQRVISEFRVRVGEDWLWMSLNATVVERDDKGRAVRIIGAQTDVTELRLARDALIRSEERFRLVLSNAPGGVATMDQSGRLTDFNASICNLTGYNSVEMTDFQFRQLLSDGDAEKFFRGLSEISVGANQSCSCEIQINRKDGTIRWGEVMASRVFDSTQDGYIYIIQINDVSHKHEVDRIKSEFIATVSHELRTPLTSIKGALGLALGPKANQLDGPTLRLLEIAATNTDRLTSLVNDILDIEKISAGKYDFKYADICGNELIREAASNIKIISDKSQVKIVCKLEERDVLVRVDPDRVMQVFSNLLSNAVKYSFPEGIVELAMSVEGEFVRFHVIDHGEGVPPDYTNSIFERFSQADSSDTRRKGGTGLGLNISKRIVESMGGEIGFNSTFGEGTEFWFTCPLTTGA